MGKLRNHEKYKKTSKQSLPGGGNNRLFYPIFWHVQRGGGVEGVWGKTHLNNHKNNLHSFHYSLFKTYDKHYKSL